MEVLVLPLASDFDVVMTYVDLFLKLAVVSELVVQIVCEGG